MRTVIKISISKSRWRGARIFALRLKRANGATLSLKNLKRCLKKMTTYGISCGGCGKEMLFDHTGDPGTLPAFCSDKCSIKFAKQMFQPLIEMGGILVELTCGCMAVVHGTEGRGSTQPWLVCKEGKDHTKHSTEVHDQAVAIVRKQKNEKT